jgi:hypothetical protein
MTDVGVVIVREGKNLKGRLLTILLVKATGGSGGVQGKGWTRPGKIAMNWSPA